MLILNSKRPLFRLLLMFLILDVFITNKADLAQTLIYGIRSISAFALKTAAKIHFTTIQFFICSFIIYNSVLFVTIHIWLSVLETYIFIHFTSVTIDWSLCGFNSLQYFSDQEYADTQFEYGCYTLVMQMMLLFSRQWFLTFKLLSECNRCLEDLRAKACHKCLSKMSYDNKDYTHNISTKSRLYKIRKN